MNLTLTVSIARFGHPGKQLGAHSASEKKQKVCFWHPLKRGSYETMDTW